MRKKCMVLLLTAGLVLANGCGGAEKNPDDEAVFVEEPDGEATDELGSGDDVEEYSTTEEALEEMRLKPYFSAELYMGSQSIDLAECTLASLMDSGLWTTDADEEQIISPCMVSDEIELNWSDDTSLLKTYVKLVNIYDEDVQLKDCYVASARVCSESENVTDGGHLPFKATTRDGLYKKYGRKWIKEVDSSTVCLEDISRGIRIGDIFGEIRYDRTRILELGNDVNAIYRFSDGLCELTLEVPNLLYGGIAENVDDSEKEQLKENNIAYYGIAKQKTELIEELRGQFESESLEAGINEGTGEITLPEGILFATDEYELNSEGKSYLDSVFRIYGNIILDEKYSGLISSLLIEGHTDPNGTYNYNLELSQKRADAVCSYVLESTQDGLSDKQKASLKKMMKAEGCSYDRPVLDQSGNIDMNASRRVTIKFLVQL